MGKISVKLLLSRRKWLWIMAFSLAVITSAVSSIHTASESIKSDLLEKAHHQYGEHTGALIGISDSKEAISDKSDRVGEYHLQTTMSINGDVEATVGWMDG
ncbi:MAG: hypothetical protein ACI4XL_07165 [Bacillus sp. (in: firmicutes)]